MKITLNERESAEYLEYLQLKDNPETLINLLCQRPTRIQTIKDNTLMYVFETENLIATLTRRIKE